MDQETLFGPMPPPRRKRTAKPEAVPVPEPIPDALYISNGLMFGLFNGGQESRPASIQWKRLTPITKVG